MSVSTRVGAALAAGYVLGRRRKLRLALIVASAMTNKSVRSSGLALLGRGTQGLSSLPEVEKLGKQVTTQLAGAGKAAAIAVASSGIDQLSDRLSDRTARLRDESPEDDEEEPPEDEDEYNEESEADEDPEDDRDEYEDEDQDEDEDEDGDEADEDEPADQAEPEPDEDDEPESKPRRRSTRRRAASSTGGAR